ncbi:hypothetical protein N7509_003732 [Penicillium cosmopolitanum]|uniref:Uncharacterized protein n=1 Tax=Penicillium cosmopolitanum TaxID=1131564 RepID=A0A9W9W5N6_9EURO|nr:uncharacterized protein N7509_003732 [Penicillium cosmopolitanum]KAJ5403861.1 hypothetical protein N7509_003732 [Penicillium cosmopolitanum]
MADMLEAVLFLTSITFIIAVGHSAIQATWLKFPEWDRYAFYRRYRVRLQISNKTPSLHARELVGMVPDTIPLISNPEPLAHSRQDTVLGSQRWPDYGDPRRPSYTRPIPRSMSTSIHPSQHPNLNSNPGPYQAGQESSPSTQPYTNFGATVHPHPHPYPPLSVNGVNHPFDRIATPDTVSHTPSHTT